MSDSKSGQIRLLCNVCGVSCGRSRDLNRHRDDICWKNRCDTCDEQFQHARYLTKHMKEACEASITRTICTGCGAASNDRQTFIQHRCHTPKWTLETVKIRGKSIWGCARCGGLHYSLDDLVHCHKHCGNKDQTFIDKLHKRLQVLLCKSPDFANIVAWYCKENHVQLHECKWHPSVMPGHIRKLEYGFNKDDDHPDRPGVYTRDTIAFLDQIFYNCSNGLPASRTLQTSLSNGSDSGPSNVNPRDCVLVEDPTLCDIQSNDVDLARSYTGLGSSTGGRGEDEVGVDVYDAWTNGDAIFDDTWFKDSCDIADQSGVVEHLPSESRITDHKVDHSSASAGGIGFQAVMPYRATRRLPTESYPSQLTYGAPPVGHNSSGHPDFSCTQPCTSTYDYVRNSASPSYDASGHMYRTDFQVPTVVTTSHAAENRSQLLSESDRPQVFERNPGLYAAMKLRAENTNSQLASAHPAMKHRTDNGSFRANPHLASASPAWNSARTKAAPHQ